MESIQSFFSSMTSALPEVSAKTAYRVGLSTSAAVLGVSSTALATFALIACTTPPLAPMAMIGIAVTAPIAIVALASTVACAILLRRASAAADHSQPTQLKKTIFSTPTLSYTTSQLENILSSKKTENLSLAGKYRTHFTEMTGSFLKDFNRASWIFKSSEQTPEGMAEQTADIKVHNPGSREEKHEVKNFVLAQDRFCNWAADETNREAFKAMLEKYKEHPLKDAHAIAFPNSSFKDSLNTLVEKELKHSNITHLGTTVDGMELSPARLAALAANSGSSEADITEFWAIKITELMLIANQAAVVETTGALMKCSPEGHLWGIGLAPGENGTGEKIELEIDKTLSKASVILKFQIQSPEDGSKAYVTSTIDIPSLLDRGVARSIPIKEIRYEQALADEETTFSQKAIRDHINQQIGRSIPLS